MAVHVVPLRRWHGYFLILAEHALASLTVARRSKEIGIRKILGATLQNILQLITRDFAIMLAIASAITFPAVIYFGRGWLNNFAFSAGLGWQVFVIPVVCLFVLIVCIIIYQIHRTAALDPIKALREE